MTFYETLAVIMDEKGLRPRDICERAKIPAPYMSQLKNGHTKDPTWERGVAIITALGMTPNEFVARMNEDAPAPFIAEG